MGLGFRFTVMTERLGLSSSSFPKPCDAFLVHLSPKHRLCTLYFEVVFVLALAGHTCVSLSL